MLGGMLVGDGMGEILGLVGLLDNLSGVLFSG